MSGYPPRRCKTCREIIVANRDEPETKWVHKDNPNTDHEITPLKVSEYTEAEKQG